MKKISRLSALMIGLLTVSVLSAQGLLDRDSVPLKNWDVPMYWQPNQSEEQKNQARAEANRTRVVGCRSPAGHSLQIAGNAMKACVGASSEVNGLDVGLNLNSALRFDQCLVR